MFLYDIFNLLLSTNFIEIFVELNDTIVNKIDQLIFKKALASDLRKHSYTEDYF